MRDTIIVGVCATGRVALDALVSAGRGGEVLGFLHGARQQKSTDETCDGFAVLGDLSAVDSLREKLGVRRAVVAIGTIATRRTLCGELQHAGVELVNAIHASAVIATGTTLGVNVIAAPGAVVGVGAKVRDGVLLNTSCSVDHDCEVGAFAHVCPGTHLAGSVKVGAGAWLGVGSSVIQGITIGPDAFIGAGSVVVKDVPARVLAYGAPARVVRELSDEERGRIIT